MSTLCRDCYHKISIGAEHNHAAVCSNCGGGRLVEHSELDTLSLAHIDCDAFFASVEKRDNPSLQGKPVIVGGGDRGVVAACCYIARIHGVRSAMPMFQALKRCPDAVVIKPNMDKYRDAGLAVRELMKNVTPLVEPISIDEAFLDLSGTDTLHGHPPAWTLAKLVDDIENKVGVSASVGLSVNKFLAKLASDLDKPRGFSVIGAKEAKSFLADKPVSMLWGVGKSLCRKLENHDLRTIGQISACEENWLIQKFGSIGHRLKLFSSGEDDRVIQTGQAAKSISAETTFNADVQDIETLDRHLWQLCDKISTRLKKSDLSAGGVILKLRRADFQLITRSRKLSVPTYLSEDIYNALRGLLDKEADGRFFRLIGAGTQKLGSIDDARIGDLLDSGHVSRARIEQAIDQVRAKFGSDVIGKGRGWDKGKQ